MDAWDAPACTYTAPRRLPLPQLLVLLLGGTATVGVLAAAIGASLTDVRCSVRAFLWLSLASIVLLWTALAVVHTSSRVRTLISRWLHAHGSLPAVPLLYAAAATLALALGSYGLAAATTTTNGSGDAKTDGEAVVAWPLAMATAIAVAWTVTAIALVAMALTAAIRCIQPGHETPPAIMLLRCSCCSVVVKRAVLLLPFAALTTVSLVLWRQAQARGNDCALANDLTRLLLGAVAVFGSMLATLVAISGYQWCTRRTQQTQKQRHRLHVLTLGLLLAFGAAAIAWAVHCCVWLRSRHSLVTPVSTAEVCGHLEETQRSVQGMAGALFITGALLLSVTCCCRLERHLLSDTASTPSVDLSMLSPHAIRPPALTKSPTDEAV